MSEHPDRPSKPTKEAGWDAATEQELDEVLARAASLASELSDQLAAPDDPAAHREENPLESLAEDLDGGLSQLANLVSTTAQEVSEPGPGVVPDFMAEFISPAAAAPAATAEAVEPPSTRPDPIDAAPDAAANRSGQGIIGGPINILVPSGSRARPSAEATPAPLAAPTTIPGDDPDRTTSNRLGILLDVMDRPFSWASPGVRLVVGVIAVIILLLSAVVYFLR
jgi:hypothetical protein